MFSCTRALLHASTPGAVAAAIVYHSQEHNLALQSQLAEAAVPATTNYHCRRLLFTERLLQANRRIEELEEERPHCQCAICRKAAADVCAGRDFSMKGFTTS